MSFNIEVRKKQLQSLDQYITSSRDRVFSILNYLGWNSNKILKSEEQHICPINHSHRVPLEKMDKHIQKCCLKSAGFNLDDNFLSEVPISKETSITLDTPTKIDLLNAARQKNPKFTAAWNGIAPDPMTSDRLLSTFSCDERLAMYDYCVQNTVGPPTPSEFCVDVTMLVKDEKKGGPLSEEDLLEQERNAKRRRIKYKAVHTGRSKSYTEIMREVIDNQMGNYKEYLINQQERSKTTVEDVEQLKDHNGHFPQSLSTNETYEYVQDFYSHPQTIDYKSEGNIDKLHTEDKHDKTFREEDKYDKYNRTSREEEKYDRSVREDKHDRLFRENKYDRPVRDDKYDRTFREHKYERTFKEDKHDRHIRDNKYDRNFRDEDRYEKSLNEEKHDRSYKDDKYDRSFKEHDKYSVRYKDYKEKSFSHRRHRSSYERFIERREPYNRSKYRH